MVKYDWWNDLKANQGTLEDPCLWETNLIFQSRQVFCLLCSLIYRVNGFWEAVVQIEGQIPPVLTPVDILWDEEMLFRPSDSFQSSQKHSFSAAQGLLYKNNKQLLQRHVIASHNSREINDIIIWTAAMGNND